ncbi:TniQ family protein [Kitasatospora purpeofusca]|uniref:TniQ family protein n=1 Tax=Kitasatospora purpeofusca TaxID=67352 RepID=UPI0004BECE2B|nr:TniQ family protein [Kitasatospora purpeofusca]
MTRAPGPLARSLAPFPEESLPGFLLRLAHRLNRSPARIAVLTGLAPYRLGHTVKLPAHLLVALRPESAARFAAATRLTTAEVQALGLRAHQVAYPPIADTGERPDGRFGSNVWAFTAASRFCPLCLAGDGTAVQDAHGGPWRLPWHLPVVFACPRHRRLLDHLCPSCRRPLNVSVQGRAALILHPTGHVLHPAQCRNHALDAGTRKPKPACGADLTATAADTGARGDADLGTLLDLQSRLLARLASPDPDEPLFFPDLIAVSQLITISWPAAVDDLSLPDVQVDALDEHVHAMRRRTADRPHGDNGRIVIGPPPAAAACAGLLAMSERLVTHPDPAGAREAVQTLARRAVERDRTRFVGIIRRGQFSLPLARALAVQRGGFHATVGAGTSAALRVPTRTCLFTAREIPQLLPAAAYERHLAHFTTRLTVDSRNNARLVRRAAALKLAEMTGGGALADGARLLGIPRGHALSGLQQLRLRTDSEGAWQRFLHGLDAIAAELDDQEDRIDYQRRRTALEDWTIPPADWAHLTDGLPMLDATPGLRICASVLVWTQVTEGDYLFSPLVRHRGWGGRLPGGPSLVCELPSLTGARRGDKARLLARLAAYTQRTAAWCDNGALAANPRTTP